MRKLIFVFLIGCSLWNSLITLSFAGDNIRADIPRGVWVSVFSASKVLYSRDEAVKLIALCKKAKIGQIYLQVYQSGYAYYDSREFDNSKYQGMVKTAQIDVIDFLLKEARNNNIKVFAWINLLSLGQNNNADVIKRFGAEVLTRDQYNRISGRGNPNESDKYYLREDLLFLEPGDQRVAKLLISVVEEVIERYPLFSGVHLDYVRYPMTVPFIPGSRFNNYGLSYGYGLKNIERFQEWTGLDPRSGLKSTKDYLLWDNWRRDQITSLVRRIAKRVKEKSRDLLVSAAVIPAGERAYASLFQNWAFWLEEGILDYVVLMNYTLDNQLTKELVRSSLSHRGRGKVFVGLGLYLMKDNFNTFIDQYKAVLSLNPDGVVIFAYDDIDDVLLKYLSSL
ncbi:MAG: family 10 glycosylhydrolase [Candidatus Omnitrophica bacterium]|nr:family 10 glycosylhydrolase [Candidatus Omnitrophota bacterium]